MLQRVGDLDRAIGINVRILEQAQQELRPEVSRDGLIDCRFRDFSFLNQLND